MILIDPCDIRQMVTQCAELKVPKVDYCYNIIQSNNLRMNGMNVISDKESYIASYRYENENVNHWNIVEQPKVAKVIRDCLVDMLGVLK